MDILGSLLISSFQVYNTSRNVFKFQLLNWKRGQLKTLHFKNKNFESTYYFLLNCMESYYVYFHIKIKPAFQHICRRTIR